MKTHPCVIVLAMLLPLTAAAAAITVTGHGQSYDPGIALKDARDDAVGQCTEQGGMPVEEIYNHITRANLWLADSIWRCEVP